ncbi:efflux RND transporter periplasmic adaptor subunit [Burkholderia plantarii]|uniref:efflux RND transporter periplasmic adaptor subunit n=1 Tax=Burkholderia plantarii TaxID=41899 RepID=UPI0018DBDA0F|nr:efflux RND transporter periplasmic adaptor subunit [Burkholderia plantarii]MBI0325756.1 efflux RND transporter periplasmic adaptor subunit [Burkholderia plantarii]
MSSEVTRAQGASRRRLRLAGLTGIVIAVAIVAAGIAVRAHDTASVRAWTDSNSIPTVTVITTTRAGTGPALNLPGRLEAWSSAPILARVSGYLKSWQYDIGARVKAGQELGVIETPEIDQQLLQARADLESARTNAKLAEITAQRWQSLQNSDAVSKQDVDQRTSDYAARRAAVDAAQANVNRLVAQKGFARLVAPFDGVVTARRTDVGALVNAGGSSGEELFTVSDVTKLRVYVQVPQNYAPDVRSGTTATLTVPEYPGRKFEAKVVAASGAVNPQSGTTLVQLVVDNGSGALLPGGFANLGFALPASADTLRVPASAIVFDAKGTRVLTVGADGHVHYRPVTITRDLGAQVEIAGGPNAGERVVETPPDGLADGDPVRVADAGKAAPGAAPGGASGAQKAAS